MKKIIIGLILSSSLSAIASDLNITNEKTIFEGSVNNYEYWCIHKPGHRGIYLREGKWKILRIGSQNAIGYEIYQKQGEDYKFISTCVGVSDNI